MRAPAVVAILLLLAASARGETQKQSTCYGTAEKGRLENGVSLPAAGPNFQSYSSLGSALGRTCVHSAVADIVTAAYADLARELPSTVFVYGETGWCSGGSFRPHKTHQNGTSVDFMVPIRNGAGVSVPLPTGPFNEFGYSMEFDSSGKSGDLTVDFPAITTHLYFLEQEASARGIKIRRVILAPEFQRRLVGTPHWPQVAKLDLFSKSKPWVRHDEHYHVDFLPGCKPL